MVILLLYMAGGCRRERLNSEPSFSIETYCDWPSKRTVQCGKNTAPMESYDGKPRTLRTQNLSHHLIVQ